jgi:hypothetical protein
VHDSAFARPDNGTTLHHPAADRDRRPWRDIVRRGGALGMALALHLFLLVWVLTLAPAPETKPMSGEDEPVRDDALHLAFLRRPATASAAHAIASRRSPPRQHMAATTPRPRPSPPATPAAQAPPDRPLHVTLSPAPDSADATYRPGNFRDALREARHPAPTYHLPGSATPRAPGIRLRAPPPSLKQIVRMIGQSQNCYAELMGMTHDMTRFLTPDQIDRKMEADGCGPQASKEDNDPTINAIAHHFTSGH